MYRYKVSENKLITPSVRLLTLICEENSSPLLHQPGQYAAISLHDKLRPTATRCFSVTSSPTDLRTLQFSMRVNGKYTSAIQRLKVGDAVFVRGSFGSFVFNEHKHRNLILFAGGIGIAPFMSMMRYATDLQLENDIHLVYSCRSQDDIPFFEDLTKLQKRNPHIHITYVITHGDQDRLRGKQVIAGRIDGSNIDQLGISNATDEYMVCGPAPYIKAMRALLIYGGVSKDIILSEAFSQGSRRQTDTLSRWPFNAYALGGLSFLVSAFFIVATDLNKTLPTLEMNSESAHPVTTDNITVSPGDITAKVNSIAPQINTNTSQAPIIKYTNTQNTNEPVVTQRAPVVTPTVVPTPAPTPKKTVTPTVKPRTRVS